MLPQHFVCKYELICEYCNLNLARNKAPWWWSDKVETCRSVLKCFVWNYMCIRWLINWCNLSEVADPNPPPPQYILTQLFGSYYIVCQRYSQVRNSKFGVVFPPTKNVIDRTNIYKFTRVVWIIFRLPLIYKCMFWDLLNILTSAFSQRCKRLIPPAAYSGRHLSDVPLRSQQLWGWFPDDMVSVIALRSPLHFLSLPPVLCPVSNQFVPVPSRNVRGWEQAGKICNGPCLYKPHTTASLSLYL